MLSPQSMQQKYKNGANKKTLKRPMKITDILGKECVVLHSKALTKESILQELLDTLAHSKIVLNKEDVKKAVLEREHIMSTGIGNEFALPHGKTNAVTDTIGALATLDNPIDFHSLDNRPVNVVFMLIGRENAVGVHLRLLSRISRMMNDDSFRKKILDAGSPSEVLLLFDHQENELG